MENDSLAGLFDENDSLAPGLAYRNSATNQFLQSTFNQPCNLAINLLPTPSSLV